MGDGHQAFGEEVAAFALGAERTLSPHDNGADLLLRVIVGRGHAIVLNERPQRLLVRQDVGAR